MDRTQKLISQAKKAGIDTDQVVYSVCIGDVIECIAENTGEKEISTSELKELIEVGIEGTEHIDWDSPIRWTLIAYLENKEAINEKSC